MMTRGIVMAGLVPAIYVLLLQSSKETGIKPGMTWLSGGQLYSNGWMRTTWPSWSVYQTVTGSVELSIQDCRSSP